LIFEKCRSSSTKTGYQDIAEILLKVALNTINQSIKFNLLDGVLAMTEAEALPYLPSCCYIFVI
jgi:hypothetical protein